MAVATHRFSSTLQPALEMPHSTMIRASAASSGATPPLYDACSRELACTGWPAASVATSSSPKSVRFK